MSKIGWKLVTLLFAIPIARLTRKLTERLWLAIRPQNPPRDPARSATSWPDAIAWAVISAIGLAVGRLIAARSAAKVWRVAFNEDPPGVDDETADADA